MSIAGAASVRALAPRAVPERWRCPSRVLAALLVLVASLLALAPAGAPAGAAPPIGLRDVALGAASSFGVLGGSSVTSTGLTTVAQDLGVSPGASVTGFPPGQIGPPGGFHDADAAANQAHADLTVAYDDASGRITEPENVIDTELSFQMGPGVYSAADRGPLAVTGTVMLNAGGDPNAVFIFQTDSTLTTAAGTTVVLSGDAQACNVFWQVGSTATLGAGSHLPGSILAQTSIVADEGSSIEGRALAIDATVSLATTDVTTPSCAENARTRGRVTADESGDGIAGVTVRLYEDGVGYTSDVATTDGGGYYGFAADVPVGDRRIVFSDPSQGHVTEWWPDAPTRSSSTPVPFDPADEIVMEVGLAPAAEIEVAVAGAGPFTVQLYAADPAGSSATQVRTTTTGSAQFRGLRSGTYYVSVADPTGTVPTKWFDGATRSTATPVDILAGELKLLEVDMAPRNSISGTVTELDGPMTGVTVQAVVASTGAFVKGAKTDGTGNYLLSGLAPGSYKVVFRPTTTAHVLEWNGDAETRAAASPVTMVDGGAVTADAELARTAMLLGTVTGAAGASVGGAKITLYRNGLAVRSVTASVDGDWVAAGLAPGDYVLLFADPVRAHRSEYTFDQLRRADADVFTVSPEESRVIDAALNPV